MTTRILQRKNLRNRTFLVKRLSSRCRFRFVLCVFLSLLLVYGYNIKSFSYNFGESIRGIILRSGRQATRNATLYISIIPGTSGSYSLPDFTVCKAFSAVSNGHSRSGLPRRPSKHKVKNSRILKRTPSAFRLSTMIGPSALNCIESSMDGDGLNLSSHDESSIQPLYITIGPPCSGKTTWIRNRSSATVLEPNGPKIVDICIDDQPGVYHRIPSDYLLPNVDDKNGTATVRQQCLSKVLFGRATTARINELTELRAIVFRFANITTKADFRNSSIVSPLVVEVVEETICEFESKQQPILLPITIDLFVVDAIFRSSPTLNNAQNKMNDNVDDVPSLSALERIEQLLYDTPKSTPIAFGNTNSRATDYVKALQMALELKRPVHFVVYCDDKNENIDKDLFDLTVEEGIKGLIRRNVYRFLQTGRYVPEQVITDMRNRTQNLINDFIRRQRSFPSNTEIDVQKLNKLEFHQHLARLAGFIMNDERIIISTIRDQKSASGIRDKQYVTERAKNSSKKHDRPTTPSTTQSRQRPWDRPASAVRGYNGQLSDHSSEQKGKSHDGGPR